MYDIIVIGAGPAGMIAALYASRLNLSVLTIEQGAPSGQMDNTAEIENYPEFDPIMGPDLAYKMYESVSRFGTENVYGIVQDIKDHSSHKEVVCEDKGYEGKIVTIATGCIHRKLGVPGEGEFAERGVSHCTICDGASFCNKRLVIIGGGNSAVGKAIYLTRFASEVVIVHRRDELRARKIVQDRALANEKISFIWDIIVDEIVGNEMIVTGVKARNVRTGNEFDLAADGVSIYVGPDPLTVPLREAGLTNEAGWIPTDNEMKTNVPGVFAIGDVREKDLRQITIAVGDGGIVGQQVYKYLESLKETTAQV